MAFELHGRYDLPIGMLTVAGMRCFGSAGLIAIATMLMGVPPAAAQFMRDHEKEGGVRGFHGERSVGKITRDMSSTSTPQATCRTA